MNIILRYPETMVDNNNKEKISENTEHNYNISRTKHNNANQGTQSGTERNGTERNRTEQNRTKQNNTEQ